VWRVGTTARRVAPGSNGLLENRRAPASGTAAHATPRFGSAPNPATPARRPGRCSWRNHTRSPDHEAGRRATRAGNGAPTGRQPTRPTRWTDTIAPRQPGARAGGGQDPNYRLSMAAATTMSTRNSRSWTRRSQVSVVHGCRHSHGQPLLRIMDAATTERAPQRRTPMITKAGCRTSTPAALRCLVPVCAGSGLVVRGIGGGGASGTRSRSRRVWGGW
jgi:hypothetical protein